MTLRPQKVSIKISRYKLSCRVLSFLDLERIICQIDKSLYVFIFSVGYYRPLDNGNGPAAENPGFRDSSVWTEKTVPMRPEEDVHREHVLYART